MEYRIPLTALGREVDVFGKRRPQHEITLGPFAATEGTAKAAREKIAADVHAFLTAWAEPVLIAYRGFTTLLYVAPSSHEGATLVERTIGPDGASGGTSHRSFTTMPDALARARHHLAQCTTDWQDPASVWEAHDWLASFPAGGVDPYVRDTYSPADHLRYAGFQRAWAHADATGIEGGARWEYANAHRAEHVPARPPVPA